MKRFSATRSLLAFAVLVLLSLTSSPAITYLDYFGVPKERSQITGTVAHVDQKNRTITVHWIPSSSHRMGAHGGSYEQTFRVTDGTVYTNGSWDNLAKGASVRITGHSDIIDTLQFKK
jgi:hypothetical protein